MLRQTVLLFFTAVFMYADMQAQNAVASLYKRCPVRTLNFEQGLINNGTTDAITDARGFTWIAAETGMQRYNGYVLETINPLINKKQITISSPVHFFALDNGIIWISYRKGVLAYNPYNNSFTEVISTPENEELNYSILPVKETGKEVYCMQYRKGLIVYSADGKMLKKITGNNAFIQQVFDQPTIYSNVNFTTSNNSVFIYNGKDSVQKINTATNVINYIKLPLIFSFCCSNSMLYAIGESNIIDINLNDGNIKKTLPVKNVIEEEVGYKNCFFNENHQLFISLNNHLFEFDTTCNYQHEFTNLNRNVIVPVGFIRVIYADKFKRLWLLTNDDIKRIQNFNIPFEHLMYDAEKNNFVRSIFYDEQKHILLAGCYNGGIQLYDTAGNPLWQKAIVAGNVKDISSIEKLTADNYLIVTIGKGLFVLNLPAKTLKPLSQSGNAQTIDVNTINFCSNIQRTNDSTIFIGTSTDIYSCIFKKDKLVSVKPLLPLNRNTIDQLYCFLYAYNKVLWCGTATGKILKADSTGKIFTIHIPGNYLVRSLTEDVQHNIWTGTDKGLYVYNSSGNLIKSFATTSGLLNDCIYAVLPVKNKTAVFASSNLGLSYVSLKESIINYTKESGLQENEFNTQSAAITSNGKYYFGGVNGITSFYPSSLLHTSDTPVLNITKFIINDVTYNAAQDFIKGDSINLKYPKNSIQFNFSVLGLLNTDEYVYAYRLQPLENVWQTTHQPTEIKYVLQPGSYMFEVTYHPIFSSENIFLKKLYINVYPPWWKALWFRALIIVVLVFVIALITRQYNRRKYLKRIQALQIHHELQFERERISRDLHDNLGAYAAAIASNISTINNSETINDTNVLQQLKSNSQSIITQLNDTIWALNKQAISLTAVSDRFKIFLQKIQPNYPAKNVIIKENILVDEKLSPANALHLFRIMQESVNNSLKHSQCKNVFIEITSKTSWKIIIKDDGTGIDSNKKFTGNGLNNIKTRAEQAGWDIKWKDVAPTGTEVTILSSNIN